LGRELRRGRSNRLLRSSVTPAESNRRPQQLFLLGATPVLRRVRDPVWRRVGRIQELFQRRPASSHSIKPIRYALGTKCSNLPLQKTQSASGRTLAPL